MPKLKILAQNWATWVTYPKVLLHKNLKFTKFHQELTQELKIKPGTNPGTKKSQEPTQELKPKSGTKSSSSRTKLRTLSPTYSRTLLEEERAQNFRSRAELEL